MRVHLAPCAGRVSRFAEIMTQHIARRQTPYQQRAQIAMLRRQIIARDIQRECVTCARRFVPRARDREMTIPLPIQRPHAFIQTAREKHRAIHGEFKRFNVSDGRRGEGL